MAPKLSINTLAILSFPSNTSSISLKTFSVKFTAGALNSVAPDNTFLTLSSLLTSLLYLLKLVLTSIVSTSIRKVLVQQLEHYVSL